MRKLYLINIIVYCFCICISFRGYGQSPEISLREFASGQIKKGVRSIGMGGNGATWGNYALVWADTCTALTDAGLSRYQNNNTFSFTAVGVNTPNLWHGLAIYAIALSQYASDISTLVKSPGPGNGASPMHGDGTNQGVFIKAAMPLGKGISVGILLSYERSQFNAIADNNATNYVRFQTGWLPSGGFGVAWQASKRFLVGFRGLFNYDYETRTDNTGIYKGLNSVIEYRLGASIGLWKGALIDFGGNARSRYNQIYNARHLDIEPNTGFEQNLYKRHFAFRFGLDETSITSGFSIRFSPVIFDLAYINNLGVARLSDLFGTKSNSVIGTFIFNYGAFRKKIDQ